MLKQKRQAKVFSGNIVFVTFFKSNYSRSWNLYQSARLAYGHQVELREFEIGRFPTIQKIKEAMNAYNKDRDIIIVMNPSQALAIPLRFLGFKRIILDAGWPLFEGVLGRNYKISFKQISTYLIDVLSCHVSSKVLAESKVQLKNFRNRYFVPRKKIEVFYTGYDETLKVERFENMNSRINPTFKVFFRGLFTPLIGLEIVAEATKLLQEKPIYFYIFSPGAPDELTFGNNSYVNREFIDNFQEIVEVLNTCDLSLGFFSSNPRVQRTIPHKTFESIFYSIPILTASSAAISEILHADTNVFFLDNPNPTSLADKIEYLSGRRYETQSAGRLARNAYNRHASFMVTMNKLRLLVDDIANKQ